MKRKKVEQIPNWVGENIFQVSSNDDVLSSFYAPTSSVVENKLTVEKSSGIETQEITDSKSQSSRVSAASDSTDSVSDVTETKIKNLVPEKDKRVNRNLMGRKNKISSALSKNVQGIYVRDASNYQTAFITLAEILPGKSLDLYKTLYKETVAADPPQPFVRLTKNELRDKSGILNQKTLNGHEKYLLAARIITKFTRSGDHSGSIYEVKKLSEAGVDATMQIEFERLLNE